MRPSDSADVLACLRSSVRCIAQSASRRSRPASTACPSTTPCTPSPSRLAKASTAASLPPRSRAPAAMAWAMGCSEACFERADEPQHLVALDALDRDDLDERHLAGGDGAGLVEHDGVDLPGRLEHLGALDEDAELRAAAGADQQRGRRGQPERARAGDDQHGDGGGERGRGGLAAAEPEPEGGDGEGDHDGHEHRRRSGRPAVAPAPCRSGRR